MELKPLDGEIKILISLFLMEFNKLVRDNILEVLHAICALKGVDLKTLEEVRQKKAEERGGFKNRIILDRTE